MSDTDTLTNAQMNSDDFIGSLNEIAEETFGAIDNVENVDDLKEVLKATAYELKNTQKLYSTSRSIQPNLTKVETASPEE